MTLTHYSGTSWRGRVPRRSLRKAQHDEIIGLFMLVIGVTLFVAPWVVGTPDGARDAHVNETAVGLVMVFVASHRLYAGGGWLSDVVTLVAGAWLASSPFLLGLGDTVVGEARVFDVAAGSVLVALALLSLALLRAARGVPPRGEHPRQEGFATHSEHPEIAGPPPAGSRPEAERGRRAA
ncbi:SPW repeat domain-containing protein [Streptomyces sp. 6N223]|uniref:SPW repeat domain-containing protein n=1 Tax=Streptomyces sp. 6N223 TaxID=3457412 RepID=UPI003FCF33D0